MSSTPCWALKQKHCTSLSLSHTYSQSLSGLWFFNFLECIPCDVMRKWMTHATTKCKRDDESLAYRSMNIFPLLRWDFFISFIKELSHAIDMRMSNQCSWSFELYKVKDKLPKNIYNGILPLKIPNQHRIRPKIVSVFSVKCMST